MTWEQLTHLISMDGYGAYIWGSFLFVGLCLVFNTLLITKRGRQLLKSMALEQEWRRNDT